MAERLTEEARERAARLYDDRLARSGDDPSTVGWGSSHDQRIRFEVLLRDVDVRGRRVLDIGCGLGDLVPLLVERAGEDFEYLGIDIAPGVLARARDRFGGPNRSFSVGEVADVDGAFDVVVLSGALSLETGDNEGRARFTLARMHELASEIAAANFMSTYVDYQEEKNHHFSPEALFEFAKSLTPWVSLVHDYPLWEFTLQLRRHARPEVQ